MTIAVSGLSAALYRDEPEEYVVTALGSNKDICFASKNNAVPGIAIVVAGNNTALSVGVASSDITVYSATGGTGLATSTAAQIVAAMNAYPAAFALMVARLAAGQDGTGITGALTHTHGANGVVFTQIALTDSGDHLTYQAAKGYRYWTSSTLVEKQVHGAGGWVDITNSSTVILLRGSITVSAALNADDLVRATGVRRAETAFRKVMLLYDGKLKIDGKDIDTTNLDDVGWGSAISGKKSWEFSAGAFYYDGSIPISEIGSTLIAKFYAIYATAKSFVGYGTLQSLENILANTNDAQKQTITCKGAGEIYPE
jgi:hypothetical protein